MTIHIDIWAQIIESADWYARRLHRCVYVNGYIYLFGGYNDTLDTYYSDVWRSADGITWTRLTADGGWAARSGHRVVYFNSKFWLMGGAYTSGGVTTFLNDVWSSSDGVTWNNDVPTAPWGERHEFTLTEFDGKIRIIGGYGPGPAFKADVWSSADGTNWAQDGDFPQAVREHAAVVFDGKLWVMGGDEGYKPYNDTVYSSEDGDTWTLVGSAQWDGRKEHSAIVVESEGVMLIIGGTVYDVPQNLTIIKNDVWKSSDGATWTEVVQANEFPARSDYDIVSTGEKAFLIGGYDDVGGVTLYNDVWSSDVIDSANFYADKTLVSEDETVTFYDSSTAVGVSWFWDFGDEQYSEEENPTHKYKEGLYTVTLTVTNAGGQSFSKTIDDYITAYQRINPLVSSKPDMCFRIALKESQGRGVMPVSGTWVWPVLIASTVKGVSSQNENITLVLDAETMQFYRIGVPEVWEDRSGAYDSADIATFAMFPEMYSRAGAHENIRHVESHVAMRSYDEETYRNATGFDSDGLKDGQQLSLEIYKNGEQIVPDSTLIKINKDGDYAFLKDEEAKRIQIKLKTTTSAYRVISMGTFCNELAKRTPPSINYTVQKQYQREFALPVFWLTNNKPEPETDRATGVDLEGTATAVTGPDGNASATELDSSIDFAYLTSDFTMSFWANEDVSILIGEYTVSITDDVLTVSGADINLTTGWKCVTLVKEGLTLSVFESGTLKQEITVSADAIGGTIDLEGTFFDFRIMSTATSDAAIAYYVENYSEFIP